MDLKNIKRVTGVLCLLCLLVVCGLLAFTPMGRAYVRSALLVADILSGTPKSLLRYISQDPIIHTVEFPVFNAIVEAALYQPVTSGKHPAIIFALGYPSNINDPMLDRLSEDLARLGFVILIPRLIGMQNGELVHDDVEILVSAFEWLSTLPEVDAEHIGFSGFCVGSSLGLVAAQDTRINQQVAVVNVFGGYYDLTSLLRAVSAQSSVYQNEEFPWQPAEQSVNLFVKNVLLYLNNTVDREILMVFYQNRDSNSSHPAGLSPLGEIAYELLTTSNTQAVDALLEQIPPEIQDQLDRISPKTGMSALRAKVFIMHDISDPYVPVTESYHLADAIQDPDRKVYAKFVLFEHVRPSGVLDRVTLVREGGRLIVFLGEFLNSLVVDR